MNDIIFRVIVPDNKILFKTLMLKGERGDDGVSIVSFEKTQTIGLTDYYTITLNDGTTYEFTVQNGTNAYFDDELSLLSENAVQNKIITAAINSINAVLVSIQQYDAALSGSSENAVQNKVVKSAIDSINSAIALLGQYDSALSDSSENAVQNKVVKAALDLKANLTALNDYYTKTEINNAFNNLGASGVSYNNTSSGLSATDAQAAIDELAQGGGGNANTIECTQAQYDAWKIAGTLQRETTYIITDGQNVTCNLEELDNVNISGSPSGKVLMNNGSGWVDSDATTVTFTAESGYSISSISACCLNKLVVGNINISSASFTSGSWVKIGKLNKVPTDMVRVSALNITNGSFFGMVRIETDGNVYFYPTLTATLGVGFSFGYMTT